MLVVCDKMDIQLSRIQYLELLRVLKQSVTGKSNKNAILLMGCKREYSRCLPADEFSIQFPPIYKILISLLLDAIIN
jgi:hypothetical protein